MKISGYYNSLQRIDKSYLRQLRPTDEKKSASDLSKTKKKDEIVLSPRASELRKFEELAKTVPEVKQDEIGAIKKQMESGEYSVSGRSVAKSIVDFLG